MRLTKEQTKELSDAIVTMSQNLFIDEPFNSFVAATSYCKTCDDFHLHAFDGEQMLAIAGAEGFMRMMMGGGQAVIVTACKKIGASFANSDKNVLAATLVGFADSIVNDKLDKSMPIEEKMDYVNEMLERDELETKKTFITGTFSAPNNYFSVTFDIEEVHGNDLVLVNREEIDERNDYGNFYDAQETLIQSANFLNDVKSVLEPCKTGEDGVTGEKLEKFRTFIYRIEHVTSLGELDR